MNCQILCQSFLSDATCRNVPHCIRQKNTSDKMPEHMWGKIQNIAPENMSEYLSMSKKLAEYLLEKDSK